MNIVPPKSSSHRLLIVEDEFVIAHDLGKRLSRMGYDICATVSSGEKALEAADRCRPDLALMDIVLKGDLDGIETAGMLEDRFNLPVVFLTAHADGATLQRAKLVKPLGYIVKPYTDQDLSAALEVAFYREAIQRQMRERERTLMRRERQMRSAVENAADAMIIVDEDGRIQLFNPAAEWMFGYSANEIVGNDLCSILPTAVSILEAGNQKSWKTPKQNGVVSALAGVEGLHRSGAPLQIEISVTETSSDGGRYSTLTLRDKSESRTAARQLKAQNQELLKINTKLDHFAYIVSHDLRAPVRAVRNAAQWIIEDLDGKVSDGTRVNADRLAEHSARAMHMLDDLFEYSRAGFDRNGAQKVSLVDEITEIKSTLDLHVDVTIRVDGPVKTFRAHRAAIQLALRNLIENAVYHSGKPAVEISVRCEEQNPHLLFKIINNAPGMPVDFSERAFMPFAKAEQSDVRRTGIGLTLAKWVIEENGGMIKMHPNTAGGTEIWFSWARTEI